MSSLALRDVTPSTQARQARLAVAVLFALNGFIYANLLPRYPEIMTNLGLSKTELGTAIAGIPLGALVGGVFAGRAIARWTSRRVALTGAIAMAMVFCGVGFAQSWGTLVALMFITGLFDALIDVGDNAHGLRVQRLYGRSIINALHGIWCVGAVLGGLSGSLAAALAVPLSIHLLVVSALVIAAALLVRPLMLAGPDRDPQAIDADNPSDATVDPTASVTAVTTASTAPGLSTRWRARVIGRLVGLGAIATIGAMVEDIGNSWGAVYLVDELDASVGLAGSAFLAMMTAILLGRLVADRVVDRHGPRVVVAASSVLIVVGMAGTIVWPGLTMTYVGFALAGLGAAVMIPLATMTADEIPGLASGTGVAFVSWFMRFGCFAGPPLVGFIADHSGLRTAFAVGVVAGAAGLLLAPLLAGRSDQPR